MDNKIRLQKYLANCGVASRRKSEELILEGKISVNGELVNTFGKQIDPLKDIVSVSGKRVTANKKIYLLLNKPKGYVCTSKATHGEKTIIDLIDIPERVFSVGRLDMNTEGLIILTNDGEFSQLLTHPSASFPKTYRAQVKGIPTKNELIQLEKGVVISLDDREYKTAPARVKLLKRYLDTALIEIILHEGKKRQVRKMCEAIGHRVIQLTRTAIGSLKDTNLKIGQYRHLTIDEIKLLERIK